MTDIFKDAKPEDFEPLTRKATAAAFKVGDEVCLANYLDGTIYRVEALPTGDCRQMLVSWVHNAKTRGASYKDPSKFILAPKPPERKEVFLNVRANGSVGARATSIAELDRFGSRHSRIGVLKLTIEDDTDLVSVEIV